MGIALGVEAGVAAAEAAEAAEAGATIAEGAEGAEAAAEGIEGAAEAGETAAGEAGEAASSMEEGAVAAQEAETSAKMSDVFVKFMAIDDVMRQAKEIIAKFSGSTKGGKKVDTRLTGLLSVLKEVFDMLKDAKEWLKDHGKESVEIEDIKLSVSAMLSNPIALLFAAAGVLIKLTDKIKTNNETQSPIGEGMVNALGTGLGKMLDAFLKFDKVKSNHEDKMPVLKSWPVGKEKVEALKSKLPA